MPYQTNSDLPKQVQKLPTHQQTVWRKTFNSALDEYKDELKAVKTAWAQVKKLTVDVKKVYEDRKQVFGWASVSCIWNGSKYEDLYDRHGDHICPNALEEAVYEYVLNSRDGGEMHLTAGAATLIESFMVTEEKLLAIGLEHGDLQIGWWVGFHVLNEDAWRRVKDNFYNDFSIEGKGSREVIQEDEEDEEEEV